jgi:hypothetical protein
VEVAVMVEAAAEVDSTQTVLLTARERLDKIYGSVVYALTEHAGEQETSLLALLTAIGSDYVTLDTVTVTDTNAEPTQGRKFIRMILADVIATPV